MDEVYRLKQLLFALADEFRAIRTADQLQGAPRRDTPALDEAEAYLKTMQAKLP